MEYPGGSRVLTGVLIKERERQERQGRRCDEGNRGWSDVAPASLAKERGKPVEAARPWN